MPFAIRKQPEINYNYDDYCNELKSRFQHNHQIAKKRIIQSKQKSNIQYDKRLNVIELKKETKFYFQTK